MVNNARGVLPYHWRQFPEFTVDVLNQIANIPWQTQPTRTKFSFSLVPAPPDQTHITFANNHINFTIPLTYPDPERREFFLNKVFAVRPLFAAVQEHYPNLTGQCVLNLDDEPRAPGLAFCANATGNPTIPDTDFLRSVGYQNERDVFTTLMPPWHARQPTLFWRGSSTGIPNDPWQEMPRIRLAFLDRPPEVDVGLTKIAQIMDYDIAHQMQALGLIRNEVPQLTFASYKYAIDIDGNTCSWFGLFVKFILQTTVVKVDSIWGWRQWYYQKLKPWYNFVPLSISMTEIYALAEWLRNNDAVAEQIAQRGRDLVDHLTFDNVINDAIPTIHDYVLAAKYAPG